MVHSRQSSSQSPSVTHSNTHWQANEAPAGSFNQELHSYVFILFQREAGMQLQTCSLIFFFFFSLNLEKSRQSCSWLKITWLDCDSHGRSESQQGWNDHRRCVHGRDCRAQADSHNNRLAEGNFLLLLSPSPPRLLPRLPASQSPVSTCCPHPKGWIIIMHTYNTAIWSNKMQMLTLFRQWCSSNATNKF